MTKAYEIRNLKDKPKGIIYADHNIVARRIGASLWGGSDFMAVTCRRAPWADEYHGQVIPRKVYKQNDFLVRHNLVKWLIGEA